MKEFKSNAGRAYKLSRDEPAEPRARQAFRRSMQARAEYLGGRPVAAVLGADVALDRVQVCAWEPDTCGCRLVFAHEPGGRRALLNAERVCEAHANIPSPQLLERVEAHNRTHKQAEDAA